MPKPSIAVAMPLHGQVPVECLINFTKFLEDSKQKYTVQTIFAIHQPISNARNMLVKEFLETNCDYLFFVDSDMVLPDNILENLLKHGKDFVAALSFSRISTVPTLKKLVNGKYSIYSDYPKNQLVEVDGIGMACTLLSRKLLEKLHNSTLNKPLFKCKFLNREIVQGEDVNFCELAKKEGFKVYVDTSIVAGHFGGIVKGP